MEGREVTALKKPVSRVAQTPLDGSYGADRGRRVTITLVPGNGRDLPDVMILRPSGTRRSETIALVDVYRFAMRCRVQCATLAKARDRKAKLSERRAQRRADAAESRARKTWRPAQ